MAKRLSEEEFIDSLNGREISQAEKIKFRGTKTWKKFKEQFEFPTTKVYKNGKEKPVRGTDYLTGVKLSKRWNLHHLCADSSRYTDLDRKMFVALNPQCHEFLHWAYTQMVKDPEFIVRLKEILVNMYVINKGEDFR